MEHSTDDIDNFTPEFKRYKAKNPPPDLENVIDLKKLKNMENINLLKGHRSSLTAIAGLKPIHDWKVYQFFSHPGFFFIENPFLDGYQYYWISRCLQDFPSDKNNKTNLSLLERGCDFWEKFAVKKCKNVSKDEPLRQLRWTTLGYHYNWSTKEYSEENKAEFPKDVSCLSQYLADCLGFNQYKAEAAIINYYHTDSTLAGHTDHSELNHSAPLFSISFGQTAIFLLGGKTKSAKPVALYVRSGDICVMSGESRLAYHAVPKILHSELLLPAVHMSLPHVKDKCLSCYSLEHQNVGNIEHECHDQCVVDEISVKNTGHFCYSIMHTKATQCFSETYHENIKNVNTKINSVISVHDTEAFDVYLSTSRINLNVRQVLPSGVLSLQDISHSNACN